MYGLWNMLLECRLCWAVSGKVLSREVFVGCKFIWVNLFTNSTEFVHTDVYLYNYSFLFLTSRNIYWCYIYRGLNFRHVNEDLGSRSPITATRSTPLMRSCIQRRIKIMNPDIFSSVIVIVSSPKLACIIQWHYHSICETSTMIKSYWGKKTNIYTYIYIYMCVR